MQLPLTKKFVNKVIDANFTKASAVLVGGASEIEKQHRLQRVMPLLLLYTSIIQM